MNIIWYGTFVAKIFNFNFLSKMYHKQFFSKSILKAIVDILLIVGILISILSSRRSDAASWGSFHCISSMVWYGLMIVHIWQHWRLTKAFVKPKVMRRNIFTSLTIFVFILMTVSIVLFIFGTGHQVVRIHHVISHIFWAVILIHAIQKAKQFVRLFKDVKSFFQKLSSKLIVHELLTN